MNETIDLRTAERVVAKLRGELADMEATGLGQTARAAELRRDLDVVTERLAEGRREAQEASLSALAQRNAQKARAEEAARREEKASEARVAARRWLQERCSLGPLPTESAAVQGARASGIDLDALYSVSVLVRRTRDGAMCMGLPGEYRRRDYHRVAESGP